MYQPKKDPDEELAINIIKLCQYYLGDIWHDKRKGKLIEKGPKIKPDDLRKRFPNRCTDPKGQFKPVVKGSKGGRSAVGLLKKDLKVRLPEAMQAK